jgi:hypothetical protein
MVKEPEAKAKAEPKAPPASQPLCETCTYWDPTPAQPSTVVPPEEPPAECHFHPPTITVVLSGTSYRAISAWPRAAANNWCGHHSQLSPTPFAGRGATMPVKPNIEPQ